MGYEKNKCNKKLNTIIFLPSGTKELKMLLLEQASSARLAIDEENKYEFILSTYDPQLPGSDKHKLGYFGIPTLVKIKSLTKQIFYGVKFAKKGSKHIIIKWKTREITDSTTYNISWFSRSTTENKNSFKISQTFHKNTCSIETKTQSDCCSIL
ncbi:unnamed protein product [Schistosoma haematobium]|nr:unnamed protein product [Schistosoma haematobium]